MFADTLPEENPKAQAIVRQDREKVLLIDDDETHLEILRYGLEFQGFEVTTLNCGKDIFETVARLRPDIVLLDIYLPDANGLDICQQLMDAPETATVPVIVLSGSIENSVVRQARSAGCRYFLSKPFDPNTILVMIRQAIDESRMQ